MAVDILECCCCRCVKCNNGVPPVYSGVHGSCVHFFQPADCTDGAKQITIDICPKNAMTVPSNCQTNSFIPVLIFPACQCDYKISNINLYVKSGDCTSPEGAEVLHFADSGPYFTSRTLDSFAGTCVTTRAFKNNPVIPTERIVLGGGISPAGGLCKTITLRLEYTLEFCNNNANPYCDCSGLAVDSEIIINANAGGLCTAQTGNSASVMKTFCISNNFGSGMKASYKFNVKIVNTGPSCIVINGAAGRAVRTANVVTFCGAPPYGNLGIQTPANCAGCANNSGDCITPGGSKTYCIAVYFIANNVFRIPAGQCCGTLTWVFRTTFTRTSTTPPTCGALAPACVGMGC